MVTYETLVRAWAHDRNLVHGSTPQAQMLKLTEEAGELARAIAKQQSDDAKDAIGDCAVVLIVLAAMHNLSLAECLEAAYKQIKDRKGRMVDGVFVKDAT